MLEIDKFVRDPIYGFIGLTQSEIKLLDTPFLQRLRRIKQLGNTHLVYPSACHSRFEHSLGVLHVASRMAQKLGLSDNQIRIVRYSALLHDIGHGPLSHNFEDILKSSNDQKVSHEDITRKIIAEDIDIGKILKQDQQNVLDLFDEENESVSKEIISSYFDADKLDYLRRDSYHTGVTYGVFDFERILHTINVTENDRSYLTILWKGKDALENFRLARYLMHVQVYQHHVRAISDSMFRRAVQIAIRDGTLDTDFFDIENEDFLENYLSIDDIRFFDRILSRSCPENNDYKLINCLENRILLKRGYEVNVKKLDLSKKRKIITMKPSQFGEIEEKLAGKVGCDKDFVILYKQEIENTLYRSSYASFKANETPLIVEDEYGNLHDFDEESSIHSDQEPLLKFYIFCPGEVKDKIRTVAEDILF